MMPDAKAREVVRASFARRKLEPTLAELQAVQAIGRFEGNYGSGIKLKDGGVAVGNWGAVHCVTPPKDGKCSGSCGLGSDSGPDGRYPICFRLYLKDGKPDHVSGAADLVRELYRRKGVPPALRSGDAQAIAEAMHATHYFEAPVGAYAKAIEANARTIATRLGEPELVKRGGGAVTPPAGDEDGDGWLWGLAIAAGVAVARWRRK